MLKFPFIFKGTVPNNLTITNSTGKIQQCSYKAVNLITQEKLTIYGGMVRFCFSFWFFFLFFCLHLLFYYQSDCVSMLTFLISFLSQFVTESLRMFLGHQCRPFRRHVKVHHWVGFEVVKLLYFRKF